ncbi:MAG: glycoside hydrolase family 2 TIM barrel-domain containing protein [Rikenellaceae bacterium]
MRILTFLASIVLALTITNTFAWRQRAIIEPARSEILTYNSDSLYIHNDHSKSLYMVPLNEWTKDPSCDTLYTANYTFPMEWLNREVLLRVEYADAPYTVELNGEVITSIEDGNTPTEVNITLATEEDINTVGIRLSPNSEMRKLEGWRASNRIGKTPIKGGMILVPAAMTIRDISTRTTSANGVFNSRIAVALKSYNLNDRRSHLHYKLRTDSGKVVAHGTESLLLRMRGEDTINIATILPDSTLWSNKNPELYTLELKLQHEGRYLEYVKQTIGLRKIEIAESGVVMINDKRVRLKTKEVGGSITKSQMEELKDEGYNTLHFTAGAHSRDLLNLCDELGLYAIITAPINSSRTGDNILVDGNLTNDPEWLTQYMERATRAYHAAKLHPSIVAFAIASESLNGYNLYEVYLKLKSLERDIPIIYVDNSGEWNSDYVQF